MLHRWWLLKLCDITLAKLRNQTIQKGW